MAHPHPAPAERPSDPRLSAIDVHLVPRKPPRNMYDPPQRPQQQQQVVGRKKSTRELVAQFEAGSGSRGPPQPLPQQQQQQQPHRPQDQGLPQGRYPAQRAPQSTPRRRATLTKRMPGDGLGVPYNSMPRVSSNLTPPHRPRDGGLTPPRPPEDYSPPDPRKERSPLRDSLRNLFGLFKKGKSPNEKGKEREKEKEKGEEAQAQAYAYQREKEVYRDTWHGDTSESAARRLAGGPASAKNTPEKALPPVTPEQRKLGPAALRAGYVYYLTAERQWIRRHVSLEPPFLYMTDPVLATPSLAMRLETLTSVHSLPRSSALTLPPIRQKEFPDEPYVFELEFEGGNRIELFALESASTRSSWVSVFWDAVLSMQPGPSLPPPTQQPDDPFLSLSPSLSDPMAHHRPLRVMNGSPSSNDLPSPMPRAESNDCVPGVAANDAAGAGAGAGQGSGARSKLRQSSLPHDPLGIATESAIGLSVDGAALAPVQPDSRPTGRPLPIVPQDRDRLPSPTKAEPDPTPIPADETGAEIIRFPSAFSRRSRTTPGSPVSNGLFSPQTEPDTTPTSPASSPSPKTLRSPVPTVTVERKETHDTIRLSSIRSPSPPLSRRTSYATTTNNSPRSPSIQTLSQMSVVRMRLAKLEVGEARVLPTSPNHSQGLQKDRVDVMKDSTPTAGNSPAVGSSTSGNAPAPAAANMHASGTVSSTGSILTPNRRLSSNMSSFRTPPLTLRKRDNTLLSRFPLPPAIGEVSSAGEESSTESELGRAASATPKRASTIKPAPPAEPQESQRDSSASGQTYFTSARSSHQAEGYPVEWSDSSTESDSVSGGVADRDSGSSASTTRSSTVPTPLDQHPQLDLDPVIAMLEPLPAHYSNLSEKMDDVRTGLGNVAGDVHKALQGIAELRTDIAITAAPERHTGAVDEEAWQHVRRQLSELVLLVSESMAGKGHPETVTEQNEEEPAVQTMRNLGKRDKGSAETNELSDGADGGHGHSAGDTTSGPTPDELASLFEPLLEQQKHLHLQQTDTIRYLNELNPWLQKLALTAEKGDELPSDIQRIAKALGIERPKEEEGDEASQEGPSVLAQIVEKLDGIRTIVEANQQSREAMDAVLQTLADQRQEQEKLLRTVASDLSNEIRGERLRFVDAMKEATTLNVQVHLEEFKKQLNHEVLRMTQDVGHLRDEKMKLEQAIAELFAIKAKHGEHLYHIQQATQQAQQTNQQAQARQAHKPMPPAPAQQYLHPQQVPGMMYNLPGHYISAPSQQQPQQPRYPGPPAAGRLQMPAPLGAQQPPRQGTQASRPLPAAGGRPAAASGPRSAR